MALKFCGMPRLKPEPFRRSERIDDNTITLRIAFYGIEQDRRRTPSFVDDVGNAADLQVPIRPFDRPDFTELVGLLEPTSYAIGLFHFLTTNSVPTVSVVPKVPMVSNFRT